MRTVTGYLNGTPIWSENVPASPPNLPIRGELVIGGPGPIAVRRQAVAAGEADRKADPEKWNRRLDSFRRSKAKARNG